MTTVSHTQAVCRLYRGALKMSLDWLIDRGKWRSFALALRQEFDAHKTITSEREKEELLLAGRHLLYKYRHPEPYICKLLKQNFEFFNYNFLFFFDNYVDPSAPGGSAYDRETRLPKHVNSKK